jgi:hypothetical protein
MSYNSGPPPYNPPPPGYYSSRNPRRVEPPRRSNAGLGIGMFLLGVLVTLLLGGVAVFLLYFYNPNPSAPLPRPAEQTGTPDLAATLSQTYLNREIARQLNGKPFKAGNVLIRDIVVQVKGEAQMDLTMRASSGPATFDLQVTEGLTVENGQIKINIIGQPSVTGGALPPAVNQVLDQVNNQFIEPQINSQLNAININQRPLLLTGISSSPGFITVKANVQ